jgi:4-amino-4-deoxy-L-arabinose transferase-like glycosyltransferase
MLLLVTALIIHLRGVQQQKFWLVLIAAALLGLGVNLRETVGFYAPWLVFAPFVLGWKLRRREILYVAASCVIFLLFAFGWFAYWFISDPSYRWVWFGWRESMLQESSRHPVSLWNLPTYIMLYFVSAPLVFLTVPFAPFFEWRKRRLSPMLMLWLIGFWANLLLFFNYSTTVNWRYFLSGYRSARCVLVATTRAQKIGDRATCAHWLLVCDRAAGDDLFHSRAADQF